MSVRRSFSCAETAEPRGRDCRARGVLRDKHNCSGLQRLWSVDLPPTANPRRLVVTNRQPTAVGGSPTAVGGRPDDASVRV